MATERIAGFERDHFRAITVTSIAALAGIAAAVVSSVFTAGMDPTAAATATEPLYVLAAAIGVQPLLLKAVGLMKDDFGAKDGLFIAFMTFSMWFLTRGVILTTGVTV